MSCKLLLEDTAFLLDALKRRDVYILLLLVLLQQARADKFATCVTRRSQAVDDFVTNGEWVHHHVNYKKPAWRLETTEWKDFYSSIPYNKNSLNCSRAINNSALNYFWKAKSNYSLEADEAWCPGKKEAREVELYTLCKTLKGRDLWIVGDSISGQFWMSLVYMTFSPVPRTLVSDSDPRSKLQEFNCSTYDLPLVTVRFRSDLFLNETEAWIYKISPSSIVLMNTGLWWYNVHGGTHQATLNKTLADITTATHNKNVSIIYRSTLARTNECIMEERWTEPPLRVSEHIEKTINMERNNELKELITNNYPHITNLDFNYLMSFRTDSHVGFRGDVSHFGQIDCNHYCFPSPIYSLVKIFYHVLRILDDFDCPRI